MLAELKALNTDKAPLEEMVALSAVAKIVRAEFEAKNVAVPTWLDDAQRALSREIAGRTRDALEMRLREVEQARVGLETTAEKRERLEREAESLRKQLAGQSA